jgi:glycyl-tRNA synthetase
MSELMMDHLCMYEEKDSIGKRYRRMDAIGVPFCITIDHQTLEDNTVTVRDRDTMLQDRVSLEVLHKLIDEKVSLKNHLKKLVGK